jgi:1-acyl-sn-glycerol-3-phosphate acyltransferase
MLFRRARGVWRVIHVIVHILRAAVIVAVLFPFCDPDHRRRHIQTWSRQALYIFGVKLEVDRHASAVDRTPALLVANHISWLDILAIWATTDTQFVAKSEVMDWPVFGWLAQRLGVIFIDRNRRADARDVGRAMNIFLASGRSVCIFPEGTTTDGHAISPLRPPLFQVAIDAGRPVQLVAIKYILPDRQRANGVAFTGDMTLAQSIWRLANSEGIIAELGLLEPIAAEGRDRRTVALMAQRRLSLYLQTDVELDGQIIDRNTQPVAAPVVAHVSFAQ